MPSLWAASSMFCAARPASSASGPLPEMTIATTSAAPRMFSGFQTASADRLVVAQHDEAALLAVLGAAREAAGLEDAADGVLRQRRPSYARTSRRETMARKVSIRVPGSRVRRRRSARVACGVRWCPLGGQPSRRRPSASTRAPPVEASQRPVPLTVTSGRSGRRAA